MRDYTLIRSARRTLAVEITPEGAVVVRAPLRLSRLAIDDFVAQREPWIAAHLARRMAYLQAHPLPTAEETEALRRRARAYIPDRVAWWARRMGLSPAQVKITAARKRYGSCSSAGTLCFSLYLMQHAPEAIDAVVVHELAHLRHHDHSPAFYEEVRRWLPDYDARIKTLKA